MYPVIDEKTLLEVVSEAINVYIAHTIAIPRIWCCPRHGCFEIQ